MRHMPNIASALKAEISRLARKEVRSELVALKKASTQHRAHIATLRREVDALERALKTARKKATRGRARKDGEQSQALRFRASGLASHRKRLGLSAADLGKPLGVSGQSVYKWETGEVRPRPTLLAAIASVRKMGRRQALKVLEAQR